MATVIPGDPRLRKTFTYQEQGWHTEHNRNWTQTVEQANDTESRLVTAEDTVAGLSQSLTSLTNVLQATNDSLQLKLSRTEYQAAHVARALATTTAAAEAGETAIQTTLLQAAIKTGDKLYAYDVSTGNAITIVVAQDAPVNATQIETQALTEDIPINTPISPDIRFMQTRITATANGLTSAVSRLDAAEGLLQDFNTIIQQTADDIQLVASQIVDYSGIISDLEAAITIQADEIALRVTSAEFDDLQGLVSSLEASITIQADQITSLVSSVESQNGITTNLNTRVTQTEQNISLLSSRVTDVEGDVANAVAMINVNADGITSTVSSIQAVENSIISLDTRVTQTESDITLKASVSDIVNATAANAIAQVVGTSHDGSMTTSVQVDSLSMNLYVGNKIVVVNTETLSRTTALVRENVTTGSTAIPVELVGLNAPSGSLVFIATTSLQAQFSVSAEEILSLVQKNVPQSNAIAKTIGTLSAGSNVSQLSVTRLDVTLYPLEQIIMIDEEGEVQKFTVSVQANESAGATTINVNARTVPNPIDAGTDIKIPALTLISRIKQNSDLIELSVQQGDIISSLNIEFDNINVNTYAFRSSNWDGTLNTLDPENVVISGSGTEGWALTNGGEADITGTFRTGGGTIKLTEDLITMDVEGAVGGLLFDAIEVGVGTIGRLYAFNSLTNPFLAIGSQYTTYLEGQTVWVDGWDQLVLSGQKLIVETANHALPTTDPNVRGQVWNDSGTLKVSNGSGATPIERDHDPEYDSIN